MSYVFVMAGKYRYEARQKDNQEDFQMDVEIGRRLGESLVKSFYVENDARTMGVFFLALDFAEKHNSKKNPSLKSLEKAVNDLLSQK